MNQDFLKESVFEPKFLQLVRFRRDIFTACQNLSQQFYHSPDFETTSLQRVQFWINDVKLCPTSTQIFKTRQMMNRDFYSVSEFDTTILSHASFWMNKFTFQTLKQNSFHKVNLLEKKHIQSTLPRKNQIFKQIFTSLQNANQEF